MTPLKRMRLNNEHDRVDDKGITAIRVRMDVYDKERERVIVMSRNIQKLSKQAIYSVHRHDFTEAQNKINAAKEIILRIMDEIISVVRDLRQLIIVQMNIL